MALSQPGWNPQIGLFLAKCRVRVATIWDYVFFRSKLLGGSCTPIPVWLNKNMMTPSNENVFPITNRFFVSGNPRWPVDSPRKGQWRGALVFSSICVWTNGWANNRDAGDLRHHRAHHGVIKMKVNPNSTYHWENQTNARTNYIGGRIPVDLIHWYLVSNWVYNQDGFPRAVPTMRAKW